MKILKFILFAFLALIILAFLGVFIFIKTFDVNKYLPQITQQIGNTINRKVSIGHAELGFDLIKGLSLQLKDMTISDDPQFSSRNFLELQTAYVGLDVMAMVQKRQIDVTRVVLTSPKISVVRLQNGTLNVQTMTPPASQPSDPGAANTSAASRPASPSAMALPAIFIKSIAVEGAQVSFEDQNAQMPLHLTISDGVITIDNFSLHEPFDFRVSVNAWGQKQNNITISGHCSLDLAKTSAHISAFQIKTDLSQWDWNKVKAITPALSSLPIAQDLKGDITIDIPQLNASAKGLDELSLQITSHVAEGTLDAKADIHGLSVLPSYTFELQTKSVKLEELIDQSKVPVELKGQADIQFSGSGESFDPQVMLQNIKGEGQMSLKNGEVDKLNILKTILDKLNFIPGLGGLLQNAVETSLPSNIKSELDTDTTVLDKAQGKIKVENKTISIQDADVESKLFSITAQGTVDFDLNTDVDVKTYLAQDLSAALTKAAKPLQGLLDEQSRIYIPGKVSGKVPSVNYKPQMDYITKKTAIAEGSQQLQKLLSKNPGVGNILNAVLGSGQSQSGTSSDNATDQTTNSQSQENSSQKVINGVLNSIFR